MSNDADRLAHVLVERLIRDGLTIAVAESLTGGLLAATFVSVPGASNCFRGGVVAYAVDTKASVLGVSAQQLETTGPVDPKVAEQMAQGVANLFAADIGVSTTGVAGPGPADGHVAGTVYVGLATAQGAKGECFHFHGSREDVRNKSVEKALHLIAEDLTITHEL